MVAGKETEMMTRQRIAEVVASWDMSDRMLWAYECCDEDQCWFLTQDIARYLGMTNEDEYDGDYEEDFGYLNDMVCERWDKEYEDFCRPICE